MDDGLIIYYTDAFDRDMVELQDDSGSTISKYMLGKTIDNNSIMTYSPDAYINYASQSLNNSGAHVYNVINKIVKVQDDFYITKYYFVALGTKLYQEVVIKLSGDNINRETEFDVDFNNYNYKTRIKSNNHNTTEFKVLNEVKGPKTHTLNIAGYDISSLYNIKVATVTANVKPYKTTNSKSFNKGSISFEINNIDVSKILIADGFDVRLSTSINGKTLPSTSLGSKKTDNSFITFRIFPTKIVGTVWVGSDFGEYWSTSSSSLILKHSIIIWSDDLGSAITSEEKTITLDPIKPTDAMGARFKTSSGSTISNWYHISDKIHFELPEIQDDIAINCKLIDENDNVVFDISKDWESTAGTNYGVRLDSGKLTMGNIYRLVSNIYAPLAFLSYTSDPIRIASTNSSYNIKNVSLNITGKDVDDKDISNDYYIPADSELSKQQGKVNINDTFYSNGSCDLNVKFKLSKHSNLSFRNTKNMCAISEEIQPSDVFLIAAAVDGDYLKTVWSDSGFITKHTFRDATDVKTYPNLTRDFGYRLVTQLTGDNNTDHNGVIFYRQKYTFEDDITTSTLDSTKEYDITVDINNSNNYKIYLVIRSNITGAVFEDAYTTYELSNLPTQGSNSSQFDIEIR